MTTTMSSPRLQRIERLGLVGIEHLDALAVQRAYQALVEPAWEGRGLRGTLGQHAMGHEGIGYGGVGKQAIERLDRALRLVQAHFDFTSATFRTCVLFGGRV